MFALARALLAAKLVYIVTTHRCTAELQSKPCAGGSQIKISRDAPAATEYRAATRDAVDAQAQKNTMSIRVGINGFGRIGRLVMRAAQSNPNISIVGVCVEIKFRAQHAIDAML